MPVPKKKSSFQTWSITFKSLSLTYYFCYYISYQPFLYNNMTRITLPRIASPFANGNNIDNFLLTFHDIAPNSASQFIELLAQVSDISTTNNPTICTQNILLKIQKMPLDDVPQNLKNYFLPQYLEQIFLFHEFTTSSAFKKQKKFFSSLFSSLSESLKLTTFSPNYQLLKKNVPQKTIPIFASLLLKTRIGIDINHLKSLSNNFSDQNTIYTQNYNLDSGAPDLDKIFQYIDEHSLSNKEYISKNFSQIPSKEDHAFVLSNNFFICKKISSDILPASPFFHLSLLAACEYADNAKTFSMLIEQGASTHHQSFFELECKLNKPYSAFYLPENFIVKAAKKNTHSRIRQALSWKIIKSYLEHSDSSLTQPIFIKNQSPISKKYPPSLENIEFPINEKHTQSPLFSIFTYHSNQTQSVLSQLHPNIINQFLHSYSPPLNNNKLFHDSLIAFSRKKEEYISENNQPHKTASLQTLFSTIDKIILEKSLQHKPLIATHTKKSKLGL